MKYERIEQAWAQQNHEDLVKLSKKLRDQEMKGLPTYLLSYLGIGCILGGKPKHALRPLWFAHLADPSDINCILNLGNCLKDLGDYRAALEVYLKAPAEIADPLITLGIGICKLELGELLEALSYLERALTLDPKSTVALLNYGRTCFRLEKVREAAKYYKQALQLDPSYAPAAINLSICAIRSHEFEQGLSLGQQVLDAGIKNDDYLRLLMTGALSAGAGRIAMDFFERYQHTASVETTFIAAEACRFLKMFERTEDLCKTVIRKEKDHFSAYIIMGLSVAELGRARDAQDMFDAAFARCDLADVPTKYLPNPWTLFAITDSAASQLLVAKRYAGNAVDKLPRTSKKVSGRKSPVMGYISPDFRSHPVAECMLPVLRAQTASSAEVHAFSLADSTIEDGMTADIEGAVAGFHRCATMEYAELRGLVEQLECDVLIDLAVYTSTGRPNYLALGLAPIQVNHLGYSGTSGAKAYDYIIGDDFLIPQKYEKYYSEEVIRLPFPVISSGLRDTSELVPHSRATHGLPEERIVFGCLATPYKFSKRSIALWSEALVKVPDSIMLFGNLSDPVFEAVKREMASYGVAAERIYRSAFQETRDEHFARLKVVDIFLDTYPYNAHSLAADAISAGVPVVTLSGEPFASRVAGSLNSYFELDRLVAKSDKEYVAAAVDLATMPTLREESKSQIVQGVAAVDWGTQYAQALVEHLTAAL